MFNLKQKLRPYRTRLVILAVVIVTLFIWHPFNDSKNNADAQTGTQPSLSRTEKAFSSVEESSLSPARQRVLAILKQEYAKDPKYYDETVLKYTEGNRESWCTDFISWVFAEADTELINPHSGYWRIPGVLTLQTYFKDNDAYALSTSDYTPKLGDVAFYIGAQTPDNSSDEHAAIVIDVDGAQITTLGGNEGSGVMRLRTESISENLEKGLVGYGKLEL